MTETIVCSHCKKEKALNAFSRSKAGKYGRHHMCRICLSDAQAEYQAKTREHNLAHGPLTEGTRLCTDCKQTKPITGFPVVLARKGGRGSRCLQCAAERQAAQRERNRQQSSTRGPVMAGTKKCARCEQVKPVTAFPANASMSGGRRPVCAQCYREQQHEYYLARKGQR